MMALNFFGIEIEYSPAKEWEIYRKIGPAKDMTLSTPSIGRFLVESGFDVELWHKDPALITQKSFSSEEEYSRFRRVLKRYLIDEEKAKGAGLKVRLRSFFVHDVLREVGDDSLSIIRVDYNGIGHFQIIYGYSDDRVNIACPIEGLLTSKIEELNLSSYFESGRSCLIVKNKAN